MPRWTEADLNNYARRQSIHLSGIKIPDSKPCERTAPLAADCSGKTQGSRCPHVRFILRRVKLLDVDAKYASCKDLLDGLSNAGLIHGDKEGQITLEVNQVKVAHYKDEQTTIEIRAEEIL